MLPQEKISATRSSQQNKKHLKAPGHEISSKEDVRQPDLSHTARRRMLGTATATMQYRTARQHETV